MDIFQLMADMLHLVACLILILKILATRNVIGLSYKTQQIYCIVFFTRYIDVFLGWKTFYLFIMKLVFIGITMYTAYLMRVKKPFCLSYDKQSDSFPHYYIYAGAFVLMMIIHKSFLPIELMWSYSIWLEAFAILPQLYMINKLKDIENITAHYVLFLGLYRIFYLFHWFLSWNSVIWTSFIAGILQSILYADFIYYFYKANQNARVIEFPV